MDLEKLRRVARLMALTYSGTEYAAARAAVLTVAYMGGFSAEEMQSFENQLFAVTPE